MYMYVCACVYICVTSLQLLDRFNDQTETKAVAYTFILSEEDRLLGSSYYSQLIRLSTEFTGTVTMISRCSSDVSPTD